MCDATAPAPARPDAGVAREREGTIASLFARLTGGSLELARLRRGVRLATVAYLCLPLLLFGAGWLRAPVAVVFIAALAVVAAGLVRSGRAGSRDPEGETAAIPLASIAAGLAPVVALVLLSGAGGFGPRTWDWLKHDAVLNDLVTQGWPVRYATEAGTTGLVYYVAYYLPAAVAGKLAGWAVANAAILATSLAGALLAALWLVVLARGGALACGVVFTVFAGMDVVGAALIGFPVRGLRPLLWEYHLANWTGLWQYSGNVSLLDFVPHQAVAAWLLTALAVDDVSSERGAPHAAALLAVALLWSPFVALGLLPIVLAPLLARGRSFVSAARAQLTAANAAALVLAAPLVAYFGARFAPLALPARYHPVAPVKSGDLWLVPLHEPLPRFLGLYVLFVLCDFAALWLLLLRASRDDAVAGQRRPLLMAAGLTLLALPFFHYGLYNDLVMRASIPALFVLQIGAARALRHRPRSAVAAAVAAVLAAGAFYSANLLRLHAAAAAHRGTLMRVPQAEAVRNLFQMQLHDGSANREEFVVQYLGAADALFFERLAGRSEPRDVTGPDPLGGDDPGARPAR